MQKNRAAERHQQDDAYKRVGGKERCVEPVQIVGAHKSMLVYEQSAGCDHSGDGDRTQRRDENQKRDLYMDASVGEYWMVDPERRAFVVIRRGHANRIVMDEMSWHPAGAAVPLVFAVARVFDA